MRILADTVREVDAIRGRLAASHLGELTSAQLEHFYRQDVVVLLNALDDAWTELAMQRGLREGAGS